MELRKRLLDGPQELRQAYMKRLLKGVTVGHHEVRLGDPGRLGEVDAERHVKSCAQKFSLFAQGWRLREDFEPPTSGWNRCSPADTCDVGRAIVD